MQLERPRTVREKLAVATCGLLSIDSAHAGFFDYDSLWDVDAATLYYTEQDRVRIIEPVLQIKKEIGDGEFVTLKLIYDSMSGATPNGAVPTNTTQTFTSPSGEKTFVTQPHELPLVEFSDTRAAISADWELPHSRVLRGQYNLNYSQETDYKSAGASAALAWDLNNKLTTFTAALGANYDQIKPRSGIPTELGTAAALSTALFKSAEVEAEAEGDEDEDSDGGGGGGKTKNGYDAMLGLTQVISRRTLMQFNLGFGKSSGYMSDPYKIVSVVDGTTGVTQSYVHEKRPDSRTRNTLYWKTVYHLPEDVVHVAYRYFQDDWDIRSHTLDFTYRFKLGARAYFEPHYRYYTQTAAKFFTYSIVSGDTPRYASADLRLAELQSNTVGVRFALPIGTEGEIGLGFDYMVQTGDKHPSEAIGVQRDEELFSDLKATSVVIDLKMKF
jgi:hypothetical protein